MKKHRVLALVYDHVVPPEDTPGIDVRKAEWKTEYDVIETLREIGHTLRVPALADRIQRIARRSYRALDLSGYARIDLRLDAAGRAYVLEANPNPNLAYGEDFAESAEVSGISYERLLARIIALGLRWEAERTG